MDVTSPARAADPEPRPDGPGTERGSRWIPVVIGATAVATLLVSFRIGTHGLWYDEGHTIGTVDRPVGDALWRIANWELNQSPFHLLILGWYRVVDTEGALRAAPALFAVASVPLTYALGRRLLGARVGAIAAVLLAVHPFVIEWGQQLRAYSMVLFLVLAATLLLVQAVERPTRLRIACYAVVAALAVYTHFFAALVLGAHALSLLLLRPGPRRLLVGAGVVGGVLLLPALEFFLNRDGDPLEWVEETSQTRLNATAGELAGGNRLQLVVYGLAAVAGLYVLGRRALDRRDPDAAWRASLPVLVLVVPPAATLLLSVTAKPLLEARFLIVAIPGLVLVAAAAIDRLSRPWAGLALAALVATSAAGLWDWYDRPPFDQWREAVAAVHDTAVTGDVVLTDPVRAGHVVRYYAERDDLPVHVGYPEDMAEANPEQVHVIARFDDEVPVAGAGLRPDMAVWLAERYDLVDEQVFAGVVVHRYDRR